MNNMLKVEILDSHGRVVSKVYLPDPRVAYCRERNLLLPDGLRAVIPSSQPLASLDLGPA